MILSQDFNGADVTAYLDKFAPIAELEHARRRPPAPDITIAGPVIYGLCPGCKDWQLEVDQPSSGPEVEEAMQEHADECPGLARMRDRLAAYNGPLGPLPLVAGAWPQTTFWRAP